MNWGDVTPRESQAHGLSISTKSPYLRTQVAKFFNFGKKQFQH